MKKIFLYKRENGKKGKIVLSEAFSWVDDEDFERVSQHRWFLMRLYHCQTEILYARRYEYINKKVVAILLHRFVLSDIENLRIDHKDGDGLNNSRENLRGCSHGQNMSNRTKRANCSSKYLGVIKERSGKYRATCKHDGAVKSVGSFVSEKEAALAYNYIAFFLKGGFAKLNDIHI